MKWIQFVIQGSRDSVRCNMARGFQTHKQWLAGKNSDHP